MKTIFVNQITPKADSDEAGKKLKEEIMKHIDEPEGITLDFKDVFVYTTRYFNNSIGQLMLEKSPDYVNETVQIININALGRIAMDHSIETATDSYAKQKSEGKDNV